MGENKRGTLAKSLISSFLVGLQFFSIPVFAAELTAPEMTVQNQQTITPQAAAERTAAATPTALPSGSLEPDSPLSEAVELKLTPVNRVINKIKRDLKNEKIDVKNLAFTTQPSPEGLYAVTATEPGYPGTSHFFVYTDSFKQVLRYDSDVFSPTKQTVFDSSKSAVFILQGNLYTNPDGSLLPGTLKGFLLNGSNTSVYETSVSQTGMTVIDPAGSQLIIENYEPTRDGSKKITLNVTKTAIKVTSVQEPYLSAAHLAQLPTALTNKNYVLQTVRDTNGGNEYYNVYNKVTGKFVAKVDKTIVPLQLGIYVNTISIPDVSADGKYLITFTSTYDTRSSSTLTPVQVLKVYDAVTGVYIKQITLETVTARKAVSAKTIIQNGKNAVLITYADGTTKIVPIA